MNSPGLEPAAGRNPLRIGPAPLLLPAIGLIAGIAVDRLAAVHLAPPSIWIYLAAGALTAAAGMAGCQASRWAPVNLLIAAAALGGLRHALADRYPPADHVARHATAEPVIVTISGRVVGAPRRLEPTPGATLAYPIGTRTRLLLEAEVIDGRTGPVTTRGTVRVSVGEAVRGVHAGDRVRVTGRLYRPGPPRNPGGYDWARRLRDRGIRVGLSCAHAASVIPLDRAASGGWAGLRNRLRDRLRGYLLDRAFAEEGPSAGVIAAMVLGRRSEVDRATNEAFVRTGNAHFLAASGLHVGWLALMGWGVLRLIGVDYRVRTIGVALLILSYVLLAEPRPSILRAGIIGLIGCWSIHRRGRAVVVNWLACSAAVILLIDPADLFRPAFQFSFVAVLAVMHLSRVTGQWLDRYVPLFGRLERALLRPGVGFPYAAKDADRTPSWPRLILAWCVRAVRLAVGVSIAAWLANIPLACRHFGRFATWGWLGTLVLWIPACLVTSIGYLKVLCGLVLPASGAWLGPLLAKCTHLMIGLVDLLARVPGTLTDGRSPSIAWIVVVYVCLYLRVYHPELIPAYWKRWIRTGHCYKILALGLVLWWAVPPRWVKADRGALNVWMLAVGNGSGGVIELPDGRGLIHDFGTRSPFDVSRVGIDFLKHRGIREIEAVFVSHPNFDHYGGVAALARHIPVKRLIINDQFERFVEAGSDAERFLQSMRDLGVAVEVVGGPVSLNGMGGVGVEVLGPPAVSQRPAPDANNSSMVLRLAWQGRSVLLTGDISEWGIGGLLAKGDIRADALVLPHHGSVVHNTAAFIEAVDPGIVVRSTGERHSLTINGIEEIVGERAYFSTADVGCVRIRIAEGEIRAWAVMGRR